MRQTPTPLLPLGGAAAGPRLDQLQALLALQIPFGAARRHPEFTGVQIGRCQMRTAVVGWRWGWAAEAGSWAPAAGWRGPAAATGTDHHAGSSAKARHAARSALGCRAMELQLAGAGI